MESKEIEKKTKFPRSGEFSSYILVLLIHRHMPRYITFSLFENIAAERLVGLVGLVATTPSAKPK